ncbi:hypothetical protein MQM1_033 [Aeromonas phage vB_AsaP_MQM1]|nr:hypothetical protein MQM1_033 [Aeromonas phage vB_AsaP_MQM1]
MLYENYPACVDCKHVIKNDYDVYRCALKPYSKSIITGDIQYHACDTQRKSYGDCGD